MFALTGGSVVGSRVSDPARDAFFEARTGVRSPWKVVTVPRRGRHHQIIPADIIDDAMEAWRQARKPIGEQWNATMQDMKQLSQGPQA